MVGANLTDCVLPGKPNMRLPSTIFHSSLERDTGRSDVLNKLSIFDLMGQSSVLVP
jgi:hypothetical protein